MWGNSFHLPPIVENVVENVVDQPNPSRKLATQFINDVFEDYYTTMYCHILDDLPKQMRKVKLPKKLIDIWALSELIVAANIEEHFTDDRWLFAVFTLIFVVLLALDRSNSLAHTQFKVLSLVHAFGVAFAWFISFIGGDPSAFVPFQVNSSWRAEVALLWTGGYVIEWTLSFERLVAIVGVLRGTPLLPSPFGSEAEKKAADLKKQFAEMKCYMPTPSNRSSMSTTASSPASHRTSVASSRLSIPSPSNQAANFFVPSPANPRKSNPPQKIDAPLIAPADIENFEPQFHLPFVPKRQAPEPPFAGARTFLVGNLPYEATEEAVVRAFAPFGPVHSFRLMKERETRLSRCFGFLKFETAEVAREAFRSAFDGEVIVRDVGSGRERRAHVEWSKEEMSSGEDGTLAPVQEFQFEAMVSRTDGPLEAVKEEDEEDESDTAASTGDSSGDHSDPPATAKNRPIKRPTPLAVPSAQPLRSTMIIGNLSRAMSEADVVKTFSEFGAVDSFRLMKDRESGESRCFGFLKMKDPKEAKLAFETVAEGAVVVRDSVSGNGKFVKADWAEAETVVSAKGLRRDAVQGADSKTPQKKMVKRKKAPSVVKDVKGNPVWGPNKMWRSP